MLLFSSYLPCSPSVVFRTLKKLKNLHRKEITQHRKFNTHTKIQGTNDTRILHNYRKFVAWSWFFGNCPDLANDGESRTIPPLPPDVGESSCYMGSLVSTPDSSHNGEVFVEMWIRIITGVHEACPGLNTLGRAPAKPPQDMM